jgi:hypothetical protein
LSRISANKEIFDAAAPPYQEALIKSGVAAVMFQNMNHLISSEPKRETERKQ